MTWWLALMLLDDPRLQAERVRAAMQASLDRQRASVQLQARSAGSYMVPWTGARASCDPVAPAELTEMIGETARKHGLDEKLVREVARQESGFNACAVSAKGAQGLMQLMPSTQTQFQVSNPFDARENLEAASKLLKLLLERYHGDISLALSAYNAGAARVDRNGGVPDIPETQSYVLSILTRFLQ